MANDQLIRILRLAKRLRSTNSYTVTELSEYFGVSKQTMQRDIDRASLVFNVTEEVKERNTVYYRIEGAIEEQALRLTRSEAITLHAALSSAQALTAAGSSSEVAAMRGKLDLLLKDTEKELARDLAGGFASQQRGFIASGNQPELIGVLIDSISQRLVCRMSYSPMNSDPFSSDIHPLRLVWHNQAMYLVATSSSSSSDIRTFAVHRIDELVQKAEMFSDIVQGMVDQKLDSAFGIFCSGEPLDVRIRFDRFIAKTVFERTYHPNEVKTQQDDGSVLYEIKSGSQWEIIPWVLSFGPWAELLEPQVWRKAIADRLQSAKALYA